MDKKNTILGLIFLGAAFWLLFTDSSRMQKQADEAALSQRAQSAQEATSQTESALPAIRADLQSVLAPEENIAEKFSYIENDFIKATFTNKGGAIKQVELKRYEKSQGSNAPYAINETDKSLIMGLAFPAQGFNGVPVNFENSFALTAKSANSLTYSYVGGGLKIVRTYSLEKSADGLSAPYTIICKTSVENLSGKVLPLEKIYISLGMALPTAGDIYGGNLAFTLYDGSGADFAKSTSFVDSSGFLGIGASKAKPNLVLDTAPAVWGAVKNQFFATIFTPKNMVGRGGFAAPLIVNESAEDKYMKNGVVGYMAFSLDTPLTPKQTWTLEGNLYVGPKEMDRLLAMGGGQEEVMNFGWFGFISRPLLALLNIIHSFIVGISPAWAWGWSIVILTLIVRLILWPLTAIQIRSSQRMGKLQGKIQEIKEKYKGDQQLIGQETMKLYGEYGINPFAGCLPILIQLPIFIGLYYMLQTSSEIRFAHFLWMDDLALPDTLSFCPSIFGFPLHILPLINAFFTYIQMSISPMPSADKAQKTMFKLMPVIMLVFFYTFPSGLVLYWTVQSLLGIAQTLYVIKTKDKVVLKKRDPKKGGFLQRLQAATAEYQKLKEQGLSDAEIKARMKKLAEEEKRRRMQERFGGMQERRKKNPGGRSTPPKNR